MHLAIADLGAQASGYSRYLCETSVPLGCGSFTQHRGTENRRDTREQITRIFFRAMPI